MDHSDELLDHIFRLLVFKVLLINPLQRILELIELNCAVAVGVEFTEGQLDIRLAHRYIDFLQDAAELENVQIFVSGGVQLVKKGLDVLAADHDLRRQLYDGLVLLFVGLHKYLVEYLNRVTELLEGDLAVTVDVKLVEGELDFLLSQRIVDLP